MASDSYLPIPPAVPEDDVSSATKSQDRQEHPRRYRGRVVCYAASILCLAILLLITVTLTSSITTRRHCSVDALPKAHLDQSSSSNSRESCGTSAAAARSLGCVFDLTLLGWVPARCHNAALAAGLLHHSEWEFYLGPNSTRPVSSDVVLAGEWDALYVQHEFTILRCTYAWRKATEVALSPGGTDEVLDGYLADAHQTNHCEMMLLRRTRLDDTGSVVYNKFVTCPYSSGTRGDNGRFGWYRVVAGRKVYRQP